MQSSLSVTVEVCLHLKSFTNVDLHKDGLYRVSLRVGRDTARSEEKGDADLLSEKGCATPYHYTKVEASPSRVNGRVVSDSLSLAFPAFVHETGTNYYSRTFLVRYIDEVFALDDRICFRTTSNVLDPQEQQLVLIAELERADIKDVSVFATGPKKYMISKDSFDEAGNVKFESMGTQKLLLNDVSSGQFEYTPIMFTDCITTGFALLEALIFTSAVGFQHELHRDGATFEGCLKHLYARAFPKLKDFDSDKVIDYSEKVRKTILGPAVRSHDGLARFSRLLGTVPLSQLEVSTFLRDTSALGADKDKLARFAEALEDEAQRVYSQLFVCWHNMLDAVSGNVSFDVLKRKWKSTAKDRAGESIIRYVCSESEMKLAKDAAELKVHEATARKLREAKEMVDWGRLPVEDLSRYQDKTCDPFVFEQLYSPIPELDVNKKRHALVLVHGYMGSSWDLRVFRNYLAVLEPTTLCLLSSANEEDTDSCIDTLGARLAEEVDAFLRRKFRNGPEKLSFVGHSLGSLIVRAALRHPLMQHYASRLHTFFSLASPHLGTQDNKSMLVQTGMWMISRWRKAVSLEQLSLGDHSDVRQSFIYKLAKEDRLHMFKHVVLVSGQQDQYVPYHSARIEVTKGDKSRKKDSCKAKVEMVDYIMQKVKPEQLVRIDFSFLFNTRSDSRLDHFIGRAAHVKVLDSHALTMTLLLHYHDRFFR